MKKSNILQIVQPAIFLLLALVPINLLAQTVIVVEGRRVTIPDPDNSGNVYVPAGAGSAIPFSHPTDFTSSSHTPPPMQPGSTGNVSNNTPDYSSSNVYTPIPPAKNWSAIDESMNTASQDALNLPPPANPFQPITPPNITVNSITADLYTIAMTLTAIKLQLQKSIKEGYTNYINQQNNYKQALDQQVQKDTDPVKESINSNSIEFQNEIISYDPNSLYEQNGLIKSDLLKTDLSKSVQVKFNNSLTASDPSVDGGKVKDVMNKSLVVLSQSNDPNAVAYALGGAALVIGAQFALSEGDIQSFNSILTVAAKTVDLSVGLFPVAGSLNDAFQISMGMAFGYDYTGQPMKAGDYALRGLGVIIGVLPAGSASVHIGQQAITDAFERGAILARQFKLGPQLLNLNKSAEGLAVRITETIGSLFPFNVVRNGYEYINSAIVDASKATYIGTILRHLDPASSPDGVEGVIRLCKMLEDESVALVDRSGIISSFKPGTIRWSILVSNMTAYRWHDNTSAAKQFGRYLTTDLIMDRRTAVQVLALPPTNKLNYLDQFNIKQGSEVLQGIVAPNFSHPGGGHQVYSPDISNLILQKNLVK